jgi:hypothetical protein
MMEAAYDLDVPLRWTSAGAPNLAEASPCRALKSSLAEANARVWASR